MKFLILFLVSFTFSMEAQKLYNLCRNTERISMPITISACVAYIEGSYDTALERDVYCLRDWQKIKWRNKYMFYYVLYPELKKASEVVGKILQFEHLCLDPDDFKGFRTE